MSILKFLFGRPILLGLLLVLVSGVGIVKGIAPVLNENELSSMSGIVKQAVEKRKRSVTKYELTVVNQNNKSSEFKLSSKLVRRDLLASTVQQPVTILYDADLLGDKQIYVMKSEGRPIISYDVSSKLIEEDRLFSRNLGLGALAVGFIFMIYGFFRRKSNTAIS